jgi:hypothetical protein
MKDINKFDIVLKLPDELKHLEVNIKPTKCINRIEKIKRIFEKNFNI